MKIKKVNLTKKNLELIKSIDDIECTVDKLGNRIETNNSQHKGKLCDYYVVSWPGDLHTLMEDSILNKRTIWQLFNCYV